MAFMVTLEQARTDVDKKLAELQLAIVEFSKEIILANAEYSGERDRGEESDLDRAKINEHCNWSRALSRALTSLFKEESPKPSPSGPRLVPPNKQGA